MSEPAHSTHPRRRLRLAARVVLAGLSVLILPLPVIAAGLASTTVQPPRGFWPNVQHFLNQFRDPWTWFGLSAQGLFFLRFFWQWIVSEKHKRSVVPVAFWYFSLTGALSMFIYGAHRRDLVVMLSGLIPCPIYIRNLMLIYSRAERLRRAGLPTGPIGSTVTDQDLPG
jgi:lipid-A-disaccharide synthase-like uncharacterized protein